VSQPAQRIQGARTVDEVVRQANIVLERINQQIIDASGTGGVSAETAASLQSQITKLQEISGAYPDLGGTGNPAPTPSSQSTTVVTDGETITGTGDDSDPISLAVPVTIGNGGTGLEQVETQQITTTGNPITSGASESEGSVTIAGVTAESAATWSIAGIPDPSWLTGIVVVLSCTANTVTMHLVNPTAGTITPIAQKVNIKVIG
jgi:hypothetical protein